MGDDEAKKAAKAAKKAEKKKRERESEAPSGTPTEETDEERKKRRKLEKAAKKASKEVGEMQAIVAVESKGEGSTETTFANPLLTGGKVVAYQNDYSEVQFTAAIAKPFSPPGEKLTKKILQLVNEAYKTKSLVNGIKLARKAAAKKTNGICVMAANVAPLDVISHLPGVLEDNSLPYIWVPSRYELGLACMQKRPVSAVVIKQEGLSESAAHTFDKVKKVVKEMHKQCFTSS